MSGKSVLVIGGGGFIGRHLVDRLVAAGAAVSVSDLRTDYQSPGAATYYVADIRVQSDVDELFRVTSPDWVIHLAAVHMIPECEANAAECMRTNVLGTQLVMAAAERCATRTVFFSSAEVYAHSDWPLSEASPRWPRTVYGISKLCGEQAANGAASGGSLIVRPFNVFGPGDLNPHLIPSLIARALRAPRDAPIDAGNLESTRDYVYVGAIADAVIQLIYQGFEGTVNLGTGRARTGHDVLRDICTLLGRDTSSRSREDLVRESDRDILVTDTSLCHELSLPVEQDDQLWLERLAGTIEWVRATESWHDQEGHHRLPRSGA